MAVDASNVLISIILFLAIEIFGIPFHENQEHLID